MTNIVFPSIRSTPSGVENRIDAKLIIHDLEAPPLSTSGQENCLQKVNWTLFEAESGNMLGPGMFLFKQEVAYPTSKFSDGTVGTG